MRKLYEWIKKNLHWLAAVLATVGGFIIGRRTRGTSTDFAKLREANSKLIDQVRQLADELRILAELNEANAAELGNLREQLREAEFLVDQSARTLESSGEDLGGLRENNQRLADWLSKYGKEIQNI